MMESKSMKHWMACQFDKYGVLDPKISTAT
jgi:hypothetical protein